jgi:hypothetical protein
LNMDCNPTEFDFCKRLATTLTARYPDATVTKEPRCEAPRVSMLSRIRTLKAELVNKQEP